MAEDPPPAEKPEDPRVSAGRFVAVGMEFGSTIAAGVIIGYYLDRWAGTPPLFTLLVTLGALGGSLYRLIWALRSTQNR